MPDSPHFCGDAGGLTNAGRPCKRRTAEGEVCAIHTGEANVGRPLTFDPTDDEVEQIEKLAAVLTQEQTADFLGVTRAAFLRGIERDPRISDAYTRGRAKAVASIGSSVFQAARAGDVNAAKFYLATQAGWSATERKEVTGKDGGAIETRAKVDVSGLDAAGVAKAYRELLRAAE